MAHHQSSLQVGAWNVNSIRSRLEHIGQYLTTHPVDFLCLQETKVTDPLFPTESIKQMGYHVFFSGQKSYNGVAILTKYENAKLIANQLTNEADEQRRLMAIEWGNLLIINVYVPNGQSVESEKYIYKMKWLSQLIEFIRTHQANYQHIIVTGDFNIAPDDLDVYDPEAWQDKILCSTGERDQLQRIQTLGFVDSFRMIHPNKKAFSWWDYRQNSFKRSLGLRIDLLLVSQALMKYCKHSVIDPTPRGWEKPSDHTPIVATFSTDFLK